MSFAEQPKMEEDGKFVGAAFKRIRKARHITLRQVEKETGLSNAYLSQLENGKILKPSYDTVMKLNKFIREMPDKKPRCPVCLSEEIKDVSLWNRRKFDMNTPIGTRFPPDTKSFDAMCCNDCGVLFRIKP